ncbi:MAG TPA: FtsX-like permease family protein [Gemmatimonadetes bacterium]|nr:FtsX-like permease family protein [Gemmatimonadota bacterium]
MGLRRRARTRERSGRCARPPRWQRPRFLPGAGVRSELRRAFGRAPDGHRRARLKLRQTEIGLRLALGAEVGAVRWMVVSEGARLLGAGIALGLLASFGISRLLSSLMFGVSNSDPLTFIGMPVLLAAVALAANLIPARRATRLDPAETLRAN